MRDGEPLADLGVGWFEPGEVAAFPQSLDDGDIDAQARCDELGVGTRHRGYAGAWRRR